MLSGIVMRLKNAMMNMVSVLQIEAASVLLDAHHVRIAPTQEIP